MFSCLGCEIVIHLAKKNGQLGSIDYAFESTTSLHFSSSGCAWSSRRNIPGQHHPSAHILSHTGLPLNAERFQNVAARPRSATIFINVCPASASTEATPTGISRAWIDQVSPPKAYKTSQLALRCPACIPQLPSVEYPR